MKIRIGTRGSKLALAQTALVMQAIRNAALEYETEIVTLTTKGDRILNQPLEQIGGKGVFIGEIEAALQSGAIDLAVHSAKDLPLDIAGGTEIAAVLERGNPQDMLVMRREIASQMQQDKSGAYRIGTGSARRISGVRRLYPNAEFADIRGNIDTRLEKLCRGDYDALVLAAAGLERLYLTADARYLCTPLSVDTVVPAPCQGIIAVQARQNEYADLMQAISHADTRICYETERGVLRLLNAGCSAPLGAFAEIIGGQLRLRVTVGHTHICMDTAEIGERFALAERLVKQL